MARKHSLAILCRPDVMNEYLYKRVTHHLASLLETVETVTLWFFDCPFPTAEAVGLSRICYEKLLNPFARGVFSNGSLQS